MWYLLFLCVISIDGLRDPIADFVVLIQEATTLLLKRHKVHTFKNVFGIIFNIFHSNNQHVHVYAEVVLTGIQNIEFLAGEIL